MCSATAGTITTLPKEGTCTIIVNRPLFSAPFEVREKKPGNELSVDLIGVEGGGAGGVAFFTASSTVLYGFFAYVSTNDYT